MYQVGIIVLTLFSQCSLAKGQNNEDDDGFVRLLSRCHTSMPDFDHCIKNLFNDLRVYFPTGVPQYSIRPFDPHRASFVEQRRGDTNLFGGYQLILRNVSEFGWTKSIATKYRTDWKNNQIIYSQYFPEKSLNGLYKFSGGVLGKPMVQKGVWNMTLYDYSQTTTVRRLGGVGGILKVNVEVNKIGGMVLHISDILGKGRNGLNTFADTVINSMWQIGLPFIKPLINDLVSTAFTDIFNESFRYFPIDKFFVW